MPDDEKPKRTKSWRDIDKGRDRGGSARAKSGDRDTERFQNSTKYTQYKSNLDRLFSGGVEMPEHLREKLDPGGALAERDEARKKLYAIEETKAFQVAAKEYLAAHEMPDDARLLDRLLGHPDEEIVEKALARLEEMQRQGSLKAPPALRQRLASVEIDTGDPQIRKRATELRKALH